MTFTTLIIVVGIGLGAIKVTINFENASECFAAIDNLHAEFFRKIDRGLTMQSVKTSCETKGTPPAAG